MQTHSTLNEMLDALGLQLRSSYPGQAVLLSPVTESAAKSLARSGSLPPFSELVVSDNDGGYRLCREDEVSRYSNALNAAVPTQQSSIDK